MPISRFCHACKNTREVQYFLKIEGYTFGRKDDCIDCCYKKKYIKSAALKEKIAKYQKEYHIKNRKILTKKKVDKNRKNKSIRLSANLASNCNYVLKRNSSDSLIFKYIGLDLIELRKYLESLFKPGMTWKNYGRGGWHIDHNTQNKI